tara:strand:- start:10401 stop:12626 length:2226 start_codon:yes stop_codon:yes gene_type:complete
MIIRKKTLLNINMNIPPGRFMRREIPQARPRVGGAPPIDEFLRQSNVKVTQNNSNSNSNSNYTEENLRLANEIEREMLRKQHVPQRLENKIISNANYGNLNKVVAESPSNNNVGNFREFMYLSNNENNEKSPNKNLTVSKLNMGMFNATVNKTLGPGNRVDLISILRKVPMPKTQISKDLYVETKEIKGIYGQFKTGFTHSRQYGAKGDLSMPFFTVQFNIQVSTNDETKGASINIYKNGKIRFSGGFVGDNIENQAEVIRSFIVDNYTNRSELLYNPFEYNNLSGQFKINGNFNNLNKIARSAHVYGLELHSYEPELSPFLFMKHKMAGDREHTYIISKSGNVQISGVETPSRMLQAYNKGVEIVNLMYQDGEISVTKAKVSSNKRKNSSTCPQARRPPCKSGFVERKNKKGFKCCYKKTKSNTKKKTNVSKSLPIINGDRIGTKKCERYSQTELYDIARKLGIVNIKTTTSKSMLCQMIKKVGTERAQIAAFKNGGKEYKLTGSRGKFRVGKKLAKLYTKADLIRFAKIMKISINEKNDKDTIAKKMEKERNKLSNKAKAEAAKPKPKPVNKKAENMKIKLAAKKTKNELNKKEMLKRRRLTNETIKSDIIELYGKTWIKKYKNVMEPITKDVNRMKIELNKRIRNNPNIRTDKRFNIFPKAVLDAFKREIVDMWKMERRGKLNKEVIKRNLNLRNVPNRLRNSYKNAVANFATSKIGNKFPGKKQVDKFKKTWLELRK